MSNTRTYQQANDVRLNNACRLIWLASWYPSRTEPYNGDFVQRHAEAVARVIPVVVIHTIHDVAAVNPVSYEVIEKGMLTEVYIYFRHDGNIRSITSRITYNLLFFQHSKALLCSLVNQYGKPDCIHVHVPMKMGRLAIWARRKWAIPYFVSEQSAAYQDGPEDSFQKRSLYYRNSVRSILQKATGVSNVSSTIGLILQEISGRHDIAVIRNVADPARFYYHAVDLPVFTFVHVSTLKEQKNINGMLRAFAELHKLRQNFHLQLVGGDLETLENIKGNYGDASWLTLHGTVDHGEVPRHMQQSNCLVMFSRDENFPCVIVEGLSCGLPVITSDAGGCPEAIEPGNGLVVRSGDEDGLLSALFQMMIHYRIYNRKKIAEGAASQYGYEKIANDFIALYRKYGVPI